MRDPAVISYAIFPDPYTDTEWMQVHHPLLRELASQLAKRGCRRVPTGRTLTFRWLLSHGRRANVIHLNWPEHSYRPDHETLLGRYALGNRWHCRLVRYLWLAKFLALVLVARLVTRHAIVWTIHDLYPHEGVTRIDRLARRGLLRQVSLAILNAPSAEPVVLAELGRPKRLVAVPLGDYRVFYPESVSPDEARRRVGLASEEVAFLCFGNISRHRNPLAVLHAFRTLDESKLRLFVIGQCRDELLRAEIRTEASRDSRVHCVLERVPNEFVEVALKACDFVIMPAVQLTSAVVVLAISFGRPVIAPEYGCNVSYVGDAGLLYKGDGELADVIARAARSHRAEYKRRAEMMARGLSWDATGEQLVRAYALAIGARGYQ